MPAIVLADEVVGHMRENVEFPDPIKIPVRTVPQVPLKSICPMLP